jgi:hypothetical protein
MQHGTEHPRVAGAVSFDDAADGGAVGVKCFGGTHRSLALTEQGLAPAGTTFQRSA